MPPMLDRVLEIVQKSGPVLPVEVASKLGLDSFLASAYLSQLAESGKIKIGAEKVGGSQIFFIPGQEPAAESRVKAILESSKKTARMFAKDVPDNPEVQQKREAFAARLREIEAKEPKQRHLVEPLATLEPGHKVMPITIKHVSQEVVGSQPSRAVGGQMMPKPKPVIKELPPEKTAEEKGLELSVPEEISYEAPQAKLEVPEETTEPQPKKSIAREVIEKTFKQKPQVLEPSKLVEAALAMLVDAGTEIIGKDMKKKGKEADIIIDLPTKLGNIKMLITVRDKKTISEADLSLAFTEGQHRKLPVVFITNGKLTKTAQNYLQVISGLLKFKQIESK